MTHTGGCHCGKVRFEIDADITRAMQCNCSICSKRATLLTFVPANKFVLLSGKYDLTDYQFHKKQIHHYFCSTCGVASFGSGAGADGKEMKAINIRCLDDFDFTKLPVDHYDGKSR